VLYTPGSNARALQKALQLEADSLIFDLEDAVAPEAKAAARAQVVEALAARANRDKEVVVRINSLNSPWGRDDLAAVAGTTANAIVLPKAESAADISKATQALAEHSRADLPIWVMSETPRGVQNIGEIALHPRVTVIVMGTSDLAKELRVSPLGQRVGLSYALGAAILAARANGIDIIDGVHLALDDAEGFRSACLAGHELGFDGKSLIHPSQIAAANELFGVTESAAKQARQIVSAWQAASAEQSGVTVVNGQLVEQLHVDEANRILQLYAQQQSSRRPDAPNELSNET
jgi:citrate lyase subunit beta/citryl-CoA lyase